MKNTILKTIIYLLAIIGSFTILDIITQALRENSTRSNPVDIIVDGKVVCDSKKYSNCKEFEKQFLEIDKDYKNLVLRYELVKDFCEKMYAMPNKVYTGRLETFESDPKKSNIKCAVTRK
jgi:hypothetical protein